MKEILSLIIVLISIMGWAQNETLEQFSFEEPAILHEVEEKYSDESLVFIQDYRSIKIDYSYPSSYQEFSVHKIIRIQDDFGLKVGQTLAIPACEKCVVLSLEIRTISAEGVVRKVNIDDLNTLDIINGNREIPINGLELNGELEYIYTYQRPLNMFGRIFFRNKFPIQDLQLTFYDSPLEFNIKGYNDIPDPQVMEGRLECHVKNLEPLIKEETQSFRSKVNYIDYRLSKYGQNNDISSWRPISNGIIKSFKFLKGKVSAFRFMADLKLDDKSQEEKIFAIENKIKTTLILSEKDIEEYTDIPSIVKSKLTNSIGQITLFVYCMQLLKIPMDFVMTISRFDGEIDDTFPQVLDLKNMLFYFPETNQYVDPLNKESRLGLPPSRFANSKSLFIQTKITMYNPSYEYVNHGFINLPMIKAVYNTTQIKCSSSLNDNLDLLMVYYEHKTTGYEAFIERYNKPFLEKEGSLESDFIEGVEDVDLVSYEFYNKESIFSMHPKKPFITKAVLTTESLVEHIDETILVHLGKLIGEKSQLYHPKNRVHDIVLDFPKLKNYELEFTLPEGYKCVNLDKLQKYISYTLDNKNYILFNTSYTIEDNLIKIIVKEGHNAYYINKENFEQYREVVNAASDFSNFTLVLEKE